ncbi:hypothetical protein EDD37DRAFT_156602 [Exophiala viscosa]|uniref:Phytocyanin domain-containing protein n=1 Tax=Exophiala viscosa TaxID=2486360 RepID=A0AAN6DQI3_9EURO|nr:hypothetical protein EDD36DRAFT_71708 [Exophiala viscosa]KAI1620497.1 hypothetical protein EDD37DRAFT_156602 [Exophiala viscosa]
MSVKALLTTALLATSAFAQYSASWGSMAAAASCPAGCQAISTTSSTSSSSQLIVQVVSVSDSNGSLAYFPNNIEAPVGSIVQFQFHPKNHTVSESSFAAPCQKIASNLTNAVSHPGLHSGFVPVTANGTFTPVYNVLINDTKPIWVYCGQTNHCQKGMAMVINQNSSSPNTIEKYIQNAMALALTPVAATQATAATSTVVAASVATVATAVTEATTATVAFGAATTSATVAAATTTADTATIAALTSTAAAPAVFTGAAVPRFQAREAQAGLGAGLVLGALVAVL